MSLTRNKYFDFMRGIAITMVVGIHTFPNLKTDIFSGIGFIYCIIRQLLNCAVPIFLAISGYFIAAKVFNDNKEFRHFLKKQIPKVYIPALIFSLPYLFIAAMDCSSIKVMVVDIIYFLICGDGVFYFIALIIQYYILSFVLLKFDRNKLLLISAIISTISIILVSYLFMH